MDKDQGQLNDVSAANPDIVKQINGANYVNAGICLLQKSITICQDRLGTNTSNAHRQVSENFVLFLYQTSWWRSSTIHTTQRCPTTAAAVAVGTEGTQSSPVRTRQSRPVRPRECSRLVAGGVVGAIRTRWWSPKMVRARCSQRTSTGTTAARGTRPTRRFEKGVRKTVFF
jgi:hypothetical protein